MPGKDGSDLVRVISGRFKGCRLVAPSGDVARPTTDRVKESMFSLMGIDWNGGIVVDLFAGSGALGIEALSRGASRAIFVDTSAKSQRAIKENLSRCLGDSSESEDCEIWRLDWQAALARVKDEGLVIGWLFVDPPYKQNLWHKVLQDVGTSSTCPTFGVVCEHPKGSVLPAQVDNLVVWKSKTYGDICVTLYRRRGENG